MYLSNIASQSSHLTALGKNWDISHNYILFLKLCVSVLHGTILTFIFTFAAVTLRSETNCTSVGSTDTDPLFFCCCCFLFAEDVTWVGSLSVWLKIDSPSRCWKNMAAYGLKLALLNWRARNPVVGLISALSSRLQKHWYYLVAINFFY